MPQAIVTIQEYAMQVLCPSVKAGTDLIALLSKCVQIERDYHADGPNKVYHQKSLVLSMEVTNMTPHKPKEKPAPAERPPHRSQIRRIHGRQLPAAPVLELEWKEGS